MFRRSRPAIPLLHRLAYSTTVSADVAKSISLRGERLTHLPAPIAAAIDAITQDANKKNIVQKSRELTNALKHMSRTKHRGGIHPNLSDQPSSTTSTTTAPKHHRRLRGSRRQQEHRALTELSQHYAPISINVEDHETMPERFWGGDEVQITNVLQEMQKERRSGSGSGNAATANGGLYAQDTALAYAISRFPACYAALHRVFRDIKTLTPAPWRPTSMLDFGAGPATATWAVHDVFFDANDRSITTNEQKHNATPQQMTVTAVEPNGAMSWLGQAIQQHMMHVPLPLPLPLPSIRWTSRLPPPTTKRYDIVVAGYVLGEMRTAKERKKRVQDLWQRTEKFLVLVEPGTPSGADTILHARQTILDLNNDTNTSSSSSSSSGSKGYVAAPCPHDGPCPLQSRPSWCHFVQKFERTAAQRRSKAIAGRLPPRSHQDERFSYVVMARGEREREEVGVVGWEGHNYDLEGEDGDGGTAGQEYLVIPTGLNPRRVGLEAKNPFYPDHAGDDDIDDESDDEAISDRSLTSNDSGNDSDSDTDSKEEEDEGSEESLIEIEQNVRRLLLESLGEDEDGDLSPELERVVQATIEELQRKRMEEGTDVPERHAMTTSSTSSDSSSSDSDRDDSTKAIKQQGDWSDAGREAAKRASSSWSRLIRPPRKRSGHIVLDVCSAVDADGNGLPNSTGTLLRQIVSKKKAIRDTGGGAAFTLARTSLWGDVWPLEYQRKLGAFEPPQGGEGEWGD